MYKSKEAQKQANLERQRRYREKLKGVTEGVTSEGVTPKGVTSNCPESVTLSDGQIWHPDPRYYKHILTQEKESDYPAVVNAVVNNRDKMESITRELKAHNVSDIVRYGIDGPTFDVVGEILDCVK